MMRLERKESNLHCYTKSLAQNFFSEKHFVESQKQITKILYMKLLIQNMVSIRCKMKVKTELEKLGINFNSIELGVVQLVGTISNAVKLRLKEELQKLGLELMLDKKAILIEKIINTIVEMVHYSENLPNINFSTFLSENLEEDYNQMAEVFSKTKGITIEHFIILHKIERIKELILYDNLNLTEISFKMNYSSVAHLSKQFKQITGLTPSFFERMTSRKQVTLDCL